MDFIKFINNKSIALKMMAYRHIYIPYRASQIRKKKKINVLFVVWSLSAWKTELLFKEMLHHPRFEPVLLIVKYCEEDDRANLKAYATFNGYPYQESDDANVNFWNKFHSDIIFFQKPYGSEYYLNLKSLFCYVPYAFHGSKDLWSIKTNYILNCWQVYYENDELAKEYSSLLGRSIHNSYGTGIPTMNELAESKQSLTDPWNGSKTKKRIIYAPHHSILSENCWHTSTFLKTGEILLRLARKYSDQVQWAFKPHPLLKAKLEEIWGKEKTDAYYKEWSDSIWSQFENGKYLGLFKYSDAMIHDCGSFMMEYHYTLNPVMYLGHDLDNNPTVQNLNSIQYRALTLHRIGYSENQIEQFILDIINGKDANYMSRKQFYDKYLLTPKGKSASQNIIDCICDQKRFNAY